MPVFAVIAGNNSATTLRNNVTKSYPGIDSVSIENGNWLIFEEKLLTPKEVCDKLVGIENLQNTLLVVPVESYWGIHNTDVWSWLTSKKL